MKEHWSVSKEKLVNLEEGATLESTSSGLKVVREQRSTCKVLVQYVKLILYVEFALLIGWACYSLWQTYRIESTEVTVADLIGKEHRQIVIGAKSDQEQVRDADGILPILNSLLHRDLNKLRHFNEKSHSTTEEPLITSESTTQKQVFDEEWYLKLDTTVHPDNGEFILGRAESSTQPALLSAEEGSFDDPPVDSVSESLESSDWNENSDEHRQGKKHNVIVWNFPMLWDVYNTKVDSKTSSSEEQASSKADSNDSNSEEVKVDNDGSVESRKHVHFDKRQGWTPEGASSQEVDSKSDSSEEGYKRPSQLDISEEWLKRYPWLSGDSREARKFWEEEEDETSDELKTAEIPSEPDTSLSDNAKWSTVKNPKVIDHVNEDAENEPSDGTSKESSYLESDSGEEGYKRPSHFDISEEWLKRYLWLSDNLREARKFSEEEKDEKSDESKMVEFPSEPEISLSDNVKWSTVKNPKVVDDVNEDTASEPSDGTSKESSSSESAHEPIVPWLFHESRLGESKNSASKESEESNEENWFPFLTHARMNEFRTDTDHIRNERIREHPVYWESGQSFDRDQSHAANMDQFTPVLGSNMDNSDYEYSDDDLWLRLNFPFLANCKYYDDTTVKPNEIQFPVYEREKPTDATEKLNWDTVTDAELQNHNITITRNVIGFGGDGFGLHSCTMQIINGVELPIVCESIDNNSESREIKQKQSQPNNPCTSNKDSDESVDCTFGIRQRSTYEPANSNEYEESNYGVYPKLSDEHDSDEDTILDANLRLAQGVLDIWKMFANDIADCQGQKCTSAESVEGEVDNMSNNMPKQRNVISFGMKIDDSGIQMWRGLNDKAADLDEQLNSEAKLEKLEGFLDRTEKPAHTFMNSDKIMPTISEIEDMTMSTGDFIPVFDHKTDWVGFFRDLALVEKDIENIGFDYDTSYSPTHAWDDTGIILGSETDYDNDNVYRKKRAAIYVPENLDEPKNSPMTMLFLRNLHKDAARGIQQIPKDHSMNEYEFQTFIQKMEHLAAHIDRLHRIYLHHNALNDDYISMELPPENY